MAGAHAASNGHLRAVSVEETATSSTGDSPVKPKPTTGDTPPKRRSKKKGPNYGEIHKHSLPITIHPLPAFHPTNPISLLRLAYVWLSQMVFPPSSHPKSLYIGYYSPETRSVHVTDVKHIRALWEMGFFGKGTLSRSEPSWLEREKARVKLKHGGGTAEEATNARRERRRLFKLERARLEAEKIERQRLVEEGKLDPLELEGLLADPASEAHVAEDDIQLASSALPEKNVATEAVDDDPTSEQEELELESIENQEHLQLTLEEAFFLAYGLGVLDIRTASPDQQPSLTTNPAAMLKTFVADAHFPRSTVSDSIASDDQFLLKYVVYHHFRSLGWVVRPGVKFSVDYLLYFRGPVFSHAEFAIMILPSYTNEFWKTEEGRNRRKIKEDQEKDWWWLHCVNRVQSQVLKTLVLVYVDVPPPQKVWDGDVGGLLRSYKVREFVIRRWIANRSRD